MGKKNHRNSLTKTKNPKVQVISQEVGGYQEALELHHKHPSLPTYFLLLDRALNAGIRLQTLTHELTRLTPIDDDQYFGAHGSRYFSENINPEQQILCSPYRQSNPGVISTCASLWKLLEDLPVQNLWGFENFLVGTADYNHLWEKADLESSGTPEGNPQETGKRTPKQLFDSALIRDLLTAMECRDETLKKLTDLSVNLGYPLVPWAVWLAEYLPSRPSLAAGIKDLSDYLDSYYTISDDNHRTDNALRTKTTNQDKENSEAIARIAGFLIFNRLFKKLVYKGSDFDLTNFFHERIQYLSSRDALEGPQNEAEYIIGISNLLMITSKLNLNSVECGLVSEQELRRSFLYDVDAENLDLACLIALPASGFAQMLTSIDPYEGDRPGEHHVSQALRVADYGMPAPWDADIFDTMFADAFSGLSPKVEVFLRPEIEDAATEWLIPLEQVTVVSQLFDGFWSDETIVEKISSSLFESDMQTTRSSRLARDALAVTTSSSYAASHHHPAIFSRGFSNKREFIEFKGAQWTDFCKSLFNAGQIRHACTILALHININAVDKFFNRNPSESIDVPTVMGLAAKLISYESFGLVRRAIADLFEFTGETPPIYKGSLQELLPQSGANIVSLKSKAEDRLEQHKMHLLEVGLNVNRLSNEAMEYLLKGRALSNDRNIYPFDLSADAVNNYLWAIEGELRYRAPEIDEDLAQELKHLDIEVDWRPRHSGPGRRGVFRGLVSICRMLEVFFKLSPIAQVKLANFRALASHANFHIFRNSLREFARIRNTVQHPEGVGLKAEEYLIRVEGLVLGEGHLARILCES